MSAAAASTEGGPLPAIGAALRERYESVRARIAAAARRGGRSPESVALVVVSKTASLEQVRELVGLGQVDFGENRVQQLVQRAAQIAEFLARRRELQRTPCTVRWHMIGRLQRNKVKKAVEHSRLIHSVDSMRLAEEIESCATKREEPVDVLVEVNVSGEESKAGISPPAVRHIVAQIDTMVNVRPRGLMCMAPLKSSEAECRGIFERCRELLEDVRRSGAGGERFDLLSMGMSNDFELAVECGANLVRIGSAILGAPALVETPD